MAETAPRTKPTNEWLRYAQDAFERSTTYFENNYRKQFEDGLRMFQSRHPSDSKYTSENYKYRSKLFRPKSRSMVRKAEAATATAFFSSPDLVSVDPVLPDDQMQVASSVVMKELLQYRLTKTLPWFLICMGGLQDAMTVGLVASLQYWDYSSLKEKQEQTGYHPELGEVTFETEVEVPVVDKPCIELLPIENVRFDPAAKWYNVAETSPYLIIELPMYVRDVKDRMEDQGEYAWKKVRDDDLKAARVTESEDGLRQARNDNKEDAQTLQSEISDFDVVMVHLVFMRKGLEDYAYYTLNDEHLLTTPVETEEMFKHCDRRGMRPVVVGFTVLETHKAVPQSPVLLGKDLQSEANTVANTRLDNVLFVLNKRWVVRRGSNIDVEAVVRNVPGGAVMANNVEQDIRELTWNDVTSSAYQEQDRINVDYDDLLGNFAQSSVMTNRKLNETVGGMKIMAQGANAITEYTLKVFVETWVEPVLRQLIKMEQFYESDEIVLGVAAEKAKLFQRFRMPGIDTNLLTQELTLSVSVGMGATDPDTRFQRFMQAQGAYMQLATNGSPDLNLPEVRKELFGLAGFKDAARFFQKPDPRYLQAKKMLAQAQQIGEETVNKHKERLARRDQQLEDKSREIDLQEFKSEVTARLTELTNLVTKAIGESQLKNRAAELRAVEGGKRGDSE